MCLARITNRKYKWFRFTCGWILKWFLCRDFSVGSGLSLSWNWRLTFFINTKICINLSSINKWILTFDCCFNHHFIRFLNLYITVYIVWMNNVRDTKKWVLSKRALAFFIMVNFFALQCIIMVHFDSLHLFLSFCSTVS